MISQQQNLRVIMKKIINIKEYQQKKIERDLVKLLESLTIEGIHNLLDLIKEDLPLTARVIFLISENNIKIV